MKLTKQEYESLFDSRLLDVDHAVRDIHDCFILQSCNDNLTMLNTLIKRAERLKEAYEAYIEADENEQVDEYMLNVEMTVGLDEALNIRGKK